MITADPAGQVTFVSAAARRLLGRDEEMIACGWADAEGAALSPADHPLARATARGETIAHPAGLPAGAHLAGAAAWVDLSLAMLNLNDFVYVK